MVVMSGLLLQAVKYACCLHKICPVGKVFKRPLIIISWLNNLNQVEALHFLFSLHQL